MRKPRDLAMYTRSQRGTALILLLGTLAAASAGEVTPGRSLNVGLLGAVEGGPASIELIDVRNKLEATGRFSSVAIFNTAERNPGSVRIEDLDALLVWNRTAPLSSDALGDTLADYVDLGGGVVMAMNSMIGGAPLVGGRFLDEDYFLITRRSSLIGPATLGNVFVPGSELMAGVETFDGGTNARRPTAEPVEGTLIAAWDDGAPLVVSSSNRPLSSRVDLGFNPTSADGRVGGWVPTTDGAALLANALERVAQRTYVLPFGPSPRPPSAVTIDKFRGNMFRVGAPQMLEEFQVKLDLDDTALLRWYIIEIDELSGDVDRVRTDFETIFPEGNRYYRARIGMHLRPGFVYAIGFRYGAQEIAYFESSPGLGRTDEPIEMLGGLFPDNWDDPNDVHQFDPEPAREVTMKLLLEQPAVETIATADGQQSFSGERRMRGNVVTVDEPRALYEIQMELDFDFGHELFWYVLESPTRFGTYTTVAEKRTFKRTMGRRYYSSGPMSVSLDPGMFYAVGVAWKNSDIRYFGEDAFLPTPFVGGTIQSSWQTNNVSAPFDELEAVLFDGFAYAMRLELDERPCALDDINRDGEVNAFDVFDFFACFASGGPGGNDFACDPPIAACVDNDEDGDIDLMDFANFQAAYRE